MAAQDEDGAALRSRWPLEFHWARNKNVKNRQDK
jgi:hypothetical protein